MFDGPVPCADDPSMFFSTNPARREEAKRVCATCPFAKECRDLSDRPMEAYQATYNIRNGVWGGVDKADAADEDVLTPKQRQQRDRASQVRVLLSEGVTSPVEIGRRIGISHGSVANIMKHHINTEEAA